MTARGDLSSVHSVLRGRISLGHGSAYKDKRATVPKPRKVKASFSLGVKFPARALINVRFLRRRRSGGNPVPSSQSFRSVRRCTCALDSGLATRVEKQISGMPIGEVVSDMLASLESHSNLVIEAPPGAGKTTCLPLALLFNATWLGSHQRILVLEPRRLAARAAAQRMASMLGEPVGRTVGYSVRMDSKVSRDTRIEVVTDGILLRRLQVARLTVLLNSMRPTGGKSKHGETEGDVGIQRWVFRKSERKLSFSKDIAVCSLKRHEL
ncbi:hypothetical protein CYMTET_33682 [Cymbomonas tetramitiformis]|uniref:Helicase ATP-binding domain-containing protein n=1 Tax=Cymbomonas tetramitiformis TaxID=36881 RepID=A0AAE0KQQ1_9CHLO|nr:hypothetical protein CYMTET_33682 [Cymbomonas tetramitiformis]